ncbi:MAG TPA: Hsp20/alpha crystallin family protein [Candidatus Marinimicrobia bacterium]|nr:Hsp20/alpha crystallin family protein [Candidatus Neomarinimicrobiota bacterium]
MAITRWNPRSSWLDVRNEFDRLFESIFNPQYEEETSLLAFSPAVDIIEEDKAYNIQVELPGMNKDDIKIAVKDNYLTISGEKKRESKVEDKNYQRTERIYGSFQRSFRLDDSVEADKIEAEFKDGVLNIVIPKKKESLAKQIEVKVK